MIDRLLILQKYQQQQKQQIQKEEESVLVLISCLILYVIEIGSLRIVNSMRRETSYLTNL